ncbi:MAG: acetate--CoA ligase [Deltaproteobacteria bacterium]|nr:acetate--CoA ligase [Deltaproteobacteria bacterium]
MSTTRDPGALAARPAIIAKDPTTTPNLTPAIAAEFTWQRAADDLAWLPQGRGLNLAHEAVDRHAVGPLGSKTALRFLGKAGAAVDVSYADLARRSSRFAHALRALGVLPQERVFTLLGRVPALFVTAIGSWKTRAVFAPLFAAFGPEPTETRLRLGDARVLVTTAALYERKVAAARSRLPALEHVILVDDVDRVPGALDFDRLLAAQPEVFEIPPTDPADPAILHFTSGTTGKPKGALHLHRAVVVHRATGKLVLDLHPDDIYWCTADPGWVTGTSYGVVAPLANGVTSIVDEAEFDAERWLSILQEQRVTVWYTAPTAIRRLMKVDPQTVRRFDLSALRFCGSVGEPLHPESVWWGQEVLGRPFHDNWWQTETGGIMIANTAGAPVKPGSMGKPAPGVEAAIVHTTDDGAVVVVDEPNVEGELALKAGWPSMFREYIGDPERTARCFVGGWYLTGDLAKKDMDGYFWFVGRADDVIKTSGHLVGPFEVESALVEHPAVADAAVIGKPDVVAGDILKAFVVLKPEHAASDEAALDILGFARTRLGAAIAPREIAFVTELPKTRSGKVMRRLLRARELGLPEGDTSTLEVMP